METDAIVRPREPRVETDAFVRPPAKVIGRRGRAINHRIDRGFSR